MRAASVPLARPLARGIRMALIIGFVLGFVGVVAWWPSTATQGRLTFDPAQMAFIETEGWRSYYDRNWMRALGLMLELNHDVFGLRWPDAILAAYYSTRAQIAFAGANNNVPLAQEYIAKYYGVIARARGLRYDPTRAAEAEMRYWIVHRQVAAQPDNPAPLVDSLADLHATLFDIPAEAARASGVERTAAAQAVDRITGHRSTDVAADWREVETRLRAGYEIVARAMGE